MSLPVQTVHFNKQPIRIYNLPDDPVFNQGDLCGLLGLTNQEAGKYLVKDLEVSTLKNESVQALNLGGVFRVIFNANNQPVAFELEQWFLQELIPSLRKYGYPYQSTHN